MIYILIGVLFQIITTAIVITVIYLYVTTTEDKIYTLLREKTSEIQKNIETQSQEKNKEFESKLRANIDTQTKQLITQETNKYNTIKSNLENKYKSIAQSSTNELTQYSITQSKAAQDEINSYVANYTSSEYKTQTIDELRPIIMQRVKETVASQIGAAGFILKALKVL